MRALQRCTRWGYLPRPTYQRSQSELWHVSRRDLCAYLCAQGDRFKLNVIDKLTDSTMLRSTTIVRVEFRPIFINYPSSLITP